MVEICLISCYFCIFDEQSGFFFSFLGSSVSELHNYNTHTNTMVSFVQYFVLLMFWGFFCISTRSNFVKNHYTPI